MPKSSSKSLKSYEESFWSKVLVLAEDQCWIFTGKDFVGDGYVRFWAGRNILAHRYSYMIVNGKIHKDKQINHTCDNPVCVNPKHLYAGTQKQNVDDCKRRGRLNRAKGEDHSCAILTEALVIECRKLYIPRHPKFGCCTLAKRFNVGRRALANAIQGKTWRHLSA